MALPAVSVVLPTYNRANIVTRAVASVWAQTFTDWELIIVDDGSNDHTCESVRVFLADSRIKYVPLEHQGVIKAINFGISQAKAEIVTFLGSDDWLKSGHLEVNLNYLGAQAGVDLVHSNALVLGDRVVPDITHPGQLIDLDECYLEGTLFVRRRVLKRTNFDEGGIGEGYRFVQKVLAAGFKIHKLASRTYVYDRSRGDSLTKRFAKSNKPTAKG